MERWGIGLDRRSKALLRRYGRSLPTKDVRAGMRVVNRKILRQAQQATVRAVTTTTPLKRGAFIGRKGQRRFSGVRMLRGVAGTFWIVARDFVLHRTGAVVQTIKGRRVRALSGRLLRRRVSADKNAFVIHKSAYERKNGRLKSIRLDVYDKIVNAFGVGVRMAAIRMPTEIHKELSKRLSKYIRRLK